MSDQLVPGASGGVLAALPHPDTLCLLSTPGPLSSGSVFSTPPIQPSNSAPSVFQFNHSLNPEKQMGKILGNTRTPSVEFEMKTEGTCVTMKCSAGFYIKVAKPTFYGLSQGYSFAHPTTTFLITEFVHQKDASGIEQSLKLVLNFTVQGVSADLVIHLYNTTQSLMVQGKRIMPDSSPAALWFVKNILYDHFASKAALHQDEISSFHDALTTLGSGTTVSSAASKTTKGRKTSNTVSAKPRPDCVVCSTKVTGNSKPMTCPTGQCSGMMHKKCIPDHISSVACSRKRRADDVSFFNLDETIDNAAPLPVTAVSTHCLTPSSSPVAPVVPLGSLPVTSCQVATTSITTSNLINTRQMVMPCTTSITTFMSVPSITFSNAAPVFTTAVAPAPPGPSVRPKTASRPPAKKPRGIATTPDEVNIDFLTRELAFAKTKITSLEAALQNKNDRIDLLSERIVTLEGPQLAQMRSEYLNPVPLPQARAAAAPQVGAAAPHTVPAGNQAAPAASLASSPAPLHSIAPAPQPIIEGVMAELALIRQQVASLQENMSTILQPGGPPTVGNSAHPPVSQAPVLPPYRAPSTSGRVSAHNSRAPNHVQRPATAQVRNTNNLPVYGAGCWINGIPTGKSSTAPPRRTLLGPPPPNVIPWSLMPTAAAAKRASAPQSSPKSILSQKHPVQAKSSHIPHSAALPKANHQKNSEFRGGFKSNKHTWTNRGCKLGGQPIQVNHQQIVRDQRIAAIDAARARSAGTTMPPPTSASVPATASGPALPPTSSSVGLLSAIPNISVQNRFQVISEEVN